MPDADQEPKFRIGLSVENPEETESEEGLVVERVMEDSPAADAGIEEGDVIIAINGEEAEDFASLQEAVQEAGKADRALKLKLQRDGKEMVLKVKPT
ncbi:MAG: PDZ domain-containing protein, partial [bacterium]